MSIHELQARLKALDEAQASGDQRAIYQAASTVVVWARRVAEGAGEPVAWRWPGDLWQGGKPSPFNEEAMRAAGLKPEFAYTTPPSADALVEAVTDHCADLDRCAGVIDANAPGFAATANEIRVAATELRAALAKHKENT